MSTHPGNERFIVFAVLVFLLPLLESRAHEGEAHESGAATQQAAVSDVPVGWSGRGDIFEVVVKALPLFPEEQALLTAYVVEVASNKPVAGARVSASISMGKDSMRAEFAETTGTLPGAYTAKLRFPDVGPYAVLFDVSRGDADDLVAVDGIRAHPGKAMAATASPVWGTVSRLYAASALGAGLCVILMIVTVTVIHRRRRARDPSIGESQP
jgi:hypothetical protein